MASDAPSPPDSAKLLIAPSKSSIGTVLADPIIRACDCALRSRGAFTIALSGGSVPSFLQTLPQSFSEAGIDPMWDRWHVLLADERCVASTDGDSNLGSIRSNFTSMVPIPEGQVYGIDEGLLSESTDAVASSYEDKVLKPLLQKCGGMLDCVVLGFGPDGHTCSLFPDHPLLEERSRLVAPIGDSPKPPSARITLTFPVLNELSRRIVFCGAGSSKRPILKSIFGKATELIGESSTKGNADGVRTLGVEMVDPAPYPCGMVRPEQSDDSLVWVVDADAAGDIIASKI